MSRWGDVPDRDARAEDARAEDARAEEPPPARRPRKRRQTVVALVLVVALALAATSLFWLIVSPGFRATTADSARLGDCLVFDPNGPTYRVADCSDPAAEFQLLATALTRDGCVDVPGATRALGAGSRFFCIGENGADPAGALNGIVAGDCVTVDAGRPVLAECASGTIPVLAVVADVPKSVGEASDGLFALCDQAGAEDVRQTYAWGLGADDGAESANWDRLLCLGAAGV